MAKENELLQPIEEYPEIEFGSDEEEKMPEQQIIEEEPQQRERNLKELEDIFNSIVTG